MKNKFSVLFLLSFIAATGFALYKNDQVLGDIKTSPDLATPEQMKQTAASNQTPVKKAKKIVTRKKTVVTE